MEKFPQYYLFHNSGQVIKINNKKNYGIWVKTCEGTVELPSFTWDLKAISKTLKNQEVREIKEPELALLL